MLTCLETRGFGNVYSSFGSVFPDLIPNICDHLEGRPLETLQAPSTAGERKFQITALVDSHGSSPIEDAQTKADGELKDTNFQSTEMTSGV